MASCFQHINECLYVVKSQLRSHWAYYPLHLASLWLIRIPMSKAGYLFF